MGFCLVERLSFTASDNMPSAATYRIINPSTKRVLDLPHDPNKRVHSMTLFQNSSTNSYYVFSIYIDEKAEPKYELLDLGGQSNDPCPNANLSWKTFSISEIAKILLGRQHIVLFLENKDILYFLVLGMVGLSNPKIICFDLVKQQTCTALKVPDQSLGLNSTNVRFSNWRGNPAVSFVLEEKVNIWVLEDYKKQKWADMIQIPLPFTKEYSSWNEPDSYKYCNDREILLRYGMELPCWIYVPKLKQWCKIPSLPRRTPATLVSVKGMQPAGEEKTHN
ncbi:hypothetical protein POM88_042829 [Heracleum sosnowskyi]|uniref:F-box associated beta-propeller type 3 domain-containing protein n=1 Tax=Heracleum sosnowskyi TaxID=360622 RepID=A0AAD8HIE8_9APIA|nr:hypothetical protein POM88_042829 [Heracleum sosnowskyi]